MVTDPARARRAGSRATPRTATSFPSTSSSRRPPRSRSWTRSAARRRAAASTARSTSIGNLNAALEPFRQKRAELVALVRPTSCATSSTPATPRARAVAEETMEKVRAAVQAVAGAVTVPNEANRERACRPSPFRPSPGPLDLLLHLIRINEVSITDIPIAEITEQYTAYLDAMRELDLDVASEYIAHGGRAHLHQVEDAPAPGAGRAGGGPARGPGAAPPRVREVQALGRDPPRDRHPAGRPLAAAGDRDPAGRGRRGDPRGLALRPDRGLPDGDRELPAGASAGAGDPPPALLGAATR